MQAAAKYRNQSKYIVNSSSITPVKYQGLCETTDWEGQSAKHALNLAVGLAGPIRLS